ncbi:MAG: hypothetical protein JRE81_09000 [Deltaproteobacteria bacterium]|nr:hypothetical protein [Deltaproteobacteria bacterium]
MLIVSASPIRFSIAFWCLLTHFLPLPKSGSPGSASRTHSADSAKLGVPRRAASTITRALPIPILGFVWMMYVRPAPSSACTVCAFSETTWNVCLPGEAVIATCSFPLSIVTRFVSLSRM